MNTEKIIPEDLVERYRLQERELLDKKEEEAAAKKAAKDAITERCKEALDTLLAGFENSFNILSKKIDVQIKGDKDCTWWKRHDHGLILRVVVYIEDDNILFTVKHGEAGTYNRWDTFDTRVAKIHRGLTASEAAIRIAEFLGKYRAFHKL